jgi:hypothetical protein
VWVVVDTLVSRIVNRLEFRLLRSSSLASYSHNPIIPTTQAPEREPLRAVLVVAIVPTKERISMPVQFYFPTLRRVAVIALALFASLHTAHFAQAQSTPDCVIFPETGKLLCGTFLDYWKSNGDLPRFGLPISDAIETSPATHRITQYFERAVFESPSSSGQPGTIRLDTLGSERLAQKYPFRDNKRTFPETTMTGEKFSVPTPWYSLSGPFLTYWQTHGAESRFSYPISPVLLEESELDGKVYTMQYFDGVVFEYHPENAPPNDVLLSQLGTLKYKTLYPQIITGNWCGPQVKISDGRDLLFGSGETGSFDAPAVLIFGRFDIIGTYVHTYTTRPYPGMEQAVRYIGSVSGDTMAFIIRFGDLPDQVSHVYTLTRGQCPR